MDALRVLVTSEARARVLTSLFSERGRSFYQSELRRATELPLIAVQRELKRLVKAGLVRQEVLAGRRVYSADGSSAVYDELSSIVRKLRGPATAVREALAARKGIDVAFVFGSFASGSSGATSDVDLMILGDAPSRGIRTALARAERDLSRTVNEHVMSAKEWSSRLSKGDPFLMNVRSGQKVWVVGSEEGLVQLDPRSTKHRR